MVLFKLQMPDFQINEMMGYIKAGDLLAIHPEIAKIVDGAEIEAQALSERGTSLRKEAESKLVTAKNYTDQANRKLNAIRRFRRATGESKG